MQCKRCNNRCITPGKKTCFQCRYNNKARYVCSEQNKQFRIHDLLKFEKIKKAYIYTLYKLQKRKCYICDARVYIKQMYIDRYNRDTQYKNNILLSCKVCYYIRDDEELGEFIEMRTDYQKKYPQIREYNKKGRIIDIILKRTRRVRLDEGQ